MTKKIQAIRGMNDILPAQMSVWHAIENALRELAHGYGYQEIRFPILEKTELFKRSVGEATDIVEKEMFSFIDRNGDELSLRPEGTACCVRAAIEHGMLYHQIQKLWYMGPLFRHERPQKGRYRQFYQFGMEAFGVSTPEIEAELILFCARLWKKLGLQQYLTLELNTLGNLEERSCYREALVAYFEANKETLDEDSQRRLHTNPLRILDSKNPALQSVIESAPKLLDFLNEDSKQHFERLCEILKNANVNYQINSRLVRGLDYYSHTVFEWTTTHLGSQSTVCAGGRYDSLVEQLGERPTPAVGFALGLERLVLLLTELNHELMKASVTPDVYCMAVGEVASKAMLALVEKLRDALPEKQIVVNCAGGSFKNQMKRADQSGARVALILGDDELQQNKVTLKYLREDKPQQLLSLDELIHHVN